MTDSLQLPLALAVVPVPVRLMYIANFKMTHDLVPAHLTIIPRNWWRRHGAWDLEALRPDMRGREGISRWSSPCFELLGRDDASHLDDDDADDHG